MNKLSSDEYKTMTADLRNTIGLHLTNDLISATQKAFGSVDNVLKYYAKGLVTFASGESWIYNWNSKYPVFYRLDANAGDEYILLYKKKA